MNISTIFLILQRQITQKWGRFLLASGGITVGIWAITLTVALSFGLSDTIVTAINSQPAAREIRLYKTPKGQSSFAELDGPPSFEGIGKETLSKLKNEIPAILETSPADFVTVYSSNLANQDGANCAQSFVDINTLLATQQLSEEDVAKKREELNYCLQTTLVSTTFASFYETNRGNWFGQTTAPERGQMVACFECGSLDFKKIFDAQTPEDLLGKKVRFQAYNTEEKVLVGQSYNVTEYSPEFRSLPEILTFELEIVAVVNDTEANSFSLTGNASSNFFLDFSYFEEIYKAGNEGLTGDRIGYFENVIFIDSYDNLDEVIAELRNRGFLPFSIAQAIISGVEVAFQVLTGVLAAFGLIALIASVFGIVNVMTISVLERKREIGILKAMGARDTDIFSIFLMESVFLGILGWFFGFGFAYLMGIGASGLFDYLVEENPDWQSNLSALNITEFNPTYPYWLVLGTLALAAFFTTVSGAIPAWQASKQNPVEVLRSE